MSLLGISMAIGVGSSIIGNKRQRDANEEAYQQQLKAEEDARKERERIFNATKPQEASATVEFGTGNYDEMGSYDDFLIPNPTSGGNKTMNKFGGIGFPV